MVSTRSKTAQTRLDDFVESDGTIKKGRKTAATDDTKKNIPSKKRRSAETLPSKELKRKRAKSSPAKTRKPAAGPVANKVADSKDDFKIVINRAPVLHLWGACVTHFIYPFLPWSTCLSAGSAISTICAVAKGRSIGTISEPDPSEEKTNKKKEARKNQKDLDYIEVMQFKLRLKDEMVLDGSRDKKGKPGSEGLLKAKFGDGKYESARNTFEEALNSWKRDEEELNKKAFGFYENFRPEVSHGQKGWGRKGELSLEKIKATVEK
jgi:hypothetical protein